MTNVVLEAGGLVRGSSGPALETFLRRESGIHHAEANYLSDTVTVGYDEAVIAESKIRSLIEQCGYHCRGEVVPRPVVIPGSPFSRARGTGHRCWPGRRGTTHLGRCKHLRNIPSSMRTMLAMRWQTTELRQPARWRKSPTRWAMAGA
jgi:hypothetical protein